MQGWAAGRDLDGDEDSGIFETLRALNTLLNASPQIEKPIRFIYAIKDSIFDRIGLEADGRKLETGVRAGRDVAGLTHHSDRGVQGGINRSSQHLDREVKRWEQPHGRSGSVRIEDRSRHRDGPRSRGGRTESRSGRLSLAA